MQRATTPNERSLRLPAALVLMCAAATSGDSIRLLEQAGADGPRILLSQVAELDGPATAKLGAMEVARFGKNEGHTVVTIAALRRALAVRRVNLATLSIRGHARCRVTRVATETTADKAEHPAPLVANFEAPLDLKSMVTVRDRLVSALVELAGLPRNELQIRLSPAEEQALGRSALRDRFEFDPGVGPLIGRLSITVRRYRGDQQVETFQVRPLVTRRMLVVVTTEKIRRGQTFTRANTKVREVALVRDRGTPVSRLTDLTGNEARSTLPAGAVVYAHDARKPHLVRRNEIMMVRCVSGGLVLKTAVRAMEDGSLDDVISVYNERAFIEGGGSRRDRAEATFLVRVTALRQGVTVSDDSQTKARPSAPSRRNRHAPGPRAG